MKRMENFKVFKFLFLSVVLLAGMILAVGCGKKEEEYRQIQIYKIDGTATVERQGSNMDAYENMQLQSGDIIETIKDSYLQLKLDEDKYILVEPESKISLQATGNSVDSKTSIYLEKGAIVNQLDNPLSEDSSYEVTTPNSTMAVRGTTFRVEITYDENGESYAKVAVYGGKVECNLVFPDGTIAEPVMVEKGTEVLVWGDDVESDYIGSGNTSYEELQLKVIDFLGVIIDSGEELSISKEELEVLKETKEALENEINEEESVEESAEEVTEEGLKEEEDSEDASEGKTPVKEELDKEEPIEEKTEQTTTQTPETTQPTPPSSESSDSSGGSSSGGSSSGENNSSSGGDSTGGNDTPSEGGSTGDNTSSIDIEFQYNSQPFATGSLQVQNGMVTVTCPTLMPGMKGEWVMQSNGNTAEGETAQSLIPGSEDMPSIEVNVEGIDKIIFVWK